MDRFNSSHTTVSPFQMPHQTNPSFAVNSYFEGSFISHLLFSLSYSGESLMNRRKSPGLILVLCHSLTYVLLCNRLLFIICRCKPVNINQCS